ncbi:hypothetical protein CDAR_607141 [Caerostris darwini]|uniref:Uncharacterized protein n=1 Tax=Caerostris darwini TaxID=1538125 RepID=A0AAV4THL1_9ARAC|nr:hypothetical protein CDAR_607141 [Caerostris darwini]
MNGPRRRNECVSQCCRITDIRKNGSAFHSNVLADVSCLGVGRLPFLKEQVIEEPRHSSTSHFPRDSSGVNGEGVGTMEFRSRPKDVEW